ncbi:hypothetical protein LCGC14_3099900, partial [marine sediment metagenome]
MKILILCRSKSGRISPYIKEQVDSIMTFGINVEYLLIRGKSPFSYLSSYPLLLKKVKDYNPDIIHAHYGLCGLLASIQRKIPVVITFHGSDINNSVVRKISKIAATLSKANIYVSSKLAQVSSNRAGVIIPCGVNFDQFRPIENSEARKMLHFEQNIKYILFSSSFRHKVKNYSLAKEAVTKTQGYKIELIELKGFDRDQVAHLLNAADLALMTSYSEGSPQFIKEALACNCPIISTNVGDVQEL